MAIQIPTTLEIIEQNIAKYESKLNQTVPSNDKSFVKVDSAIEGALQTALYKYAIERAKQCLALTATGEDLDNIGQEYDVIRGNSQATVLEIELSGTNGVTILSTNDFKGDSNGVRYTIDASGTISGGSVTLSVTASVLGVIGNLIVGDTLTIGSPVAGAETQATVTGVTTTGTNEETDDSYRQKILDVIRAQPGGGNAFDYRIWSQEVSGVARAYPYSGNPTDLRTNDGSSVPPERTVFIEADSSIDPDGIAPSSLLDDVEDNITTDLITGYARQPLGLTNDTLFVESIIRTSIYTEIRSLNVPSGNVSEVQTAIDNALTTYYLSLRPYIPGIDPEFERNDTITDITVSAIVYDVLKSYGATAQGVGFGLSAGSFITSYIMKPGELTKNGGVSYA